MDVLALDLGAVADTGRSGRDDLALEADAAPRRGPLRPSARARAEVGTAIIHRVGAAPGTRRLSRNRSVALDEVEEAHRRVPSSGWTPDR